MKTFICIIFLLLNTSFCQMMAIHKKDGSTDSISISAIQKLTFELTTTSIKTLPKIVRILSSVYPNPFHQKANIQFTIEEKSYVNIAVFDMKGTLIKRVAAKTYESGAHTAFWDGTNEYKVRASSGMYVFKIMINKEIHSKKAFLLK